MNRRQTLVSTSEAVYELLSLRDMVVTYFFQIVLHRHGFDSSLSDADQREKNRSFRSTSLLRREDAVADSTPATDWKRCSPSLEH